MSIGSLNWELCPWCGNKVKNRLDCTCKESLRNKKWHNRPASSRVVTHKYLGACPKCKTIVTEMEIDRFLKVVCTGCGKMEDYKIVKEGGWKS